MKWIFIATLALTASAQTLPDGPGKAAVIKMCTGCHDLDSVVGMHQSKDRWSAMVDEMIAKGATGSDDEINQVVAYLTANFGPKKVNVNKATAADLAAALDISAANADAIVHYRADHGDFKAPQDLTKVPGIDAKKIEDAKDRLEF
jgi:competence protein ComEA